jgi:DNA-binding transcriptional regulator YdaS (Cro superfamily)
MSENPETVETPEMAFKAAKEAAGGGAALARALGIKHPSISDWKQVPGPRVLAVEKLTGISRYRLRPDIFGSAPQEAAE